ncbi:MAG: hypothetical protein AAGF47_03490 [Planctomycetota bacterium]
MAAVSEGSLLSPQFALGTALKVDHTQLTIDGDRPLDHSALRLRAHRFADIRYPADKALLWEAMAFCQGRDPEATFYLELGHAFLFPPAVARADGSVVRVSPNDFGHTSVGAGLDLTRGGIHGRDFAR